MEWNEHMVAQTIRSWVQMKLDEKQPIPDFWSELNTTEDLAKWLHDSGLRYSR